MNEKVLNAIYSNLSKADTTFTATYDQFKTLMNDSNVRNAVYDNIRKMDSSATGTNQQFDELLGYSTKFEAEADKAADAGVANLRNKKYEALSDDEVYEQWNSILAKGEQNKEAKISKAKKEQEQFATQKPLLNAISQMQDINQSGIKATTPIESLQAQHASLFLDPSDLEEYKSLDKERGVRIHMSGNQDAKTATVNSSNIVKDIRDRAARDNKKLSASERIDLNMAERINDMSQELIEAPSKFGEESGVSNWWKGMTDTLFDRDIISVVGMVRDWEVSNVVKKLNEGEELTESENALIVAVANFDEVQKSRSSDLSTGYEIGKGTAQCVPLVIDMMVTKGLGTAGKKTLIKSLDKLVKAGKMSQKSLNNFARILNGTEGISYTVGKGDDAVKVTVGALEEGAKKTLGQYAGDAARELVETGIQTYVMPSSQRQMIQAKTDLRRESESNDILFKDRARIFGDAYTQTFTERAGGKAIDWTLGKVFGMSNVLQKFGFDRGILKLLNSAVQNPVSEVGEEYLGAVINLVRSADLFDLYSEQSNEELRDEAMSMFTSDGFWKTVGTVLPMSLFGGAANYSKIKAETRKFNQSNLELSQYLQSTGMTKSQADNILRQIEGAKDSSELNERMSILKTYLTNYIMSNNTDTEVAKGKLEAMNELVGIHANNISTYEDAIGGLKYALSSMSKEAKEKVAEDFKNLTNKANESITITPEKEGKDITPAAQDASGWTKNKYKVTIDGKKENVTIQGELFFNEDGSINSSRTDLSRVHIQNASGKNIRTTVKADKKKEVFNKYLDAINDELRKQKAEKDADAIATQKAEEVKKAELAKLKAEEKEKLDKKNAEIEAQEQAIAAQEADRQSIIASFPKDKNGEVDIDKMSPEQFFVYESDTDTPEAAMNTVGDVLNDLYKQLENNANEANREKQARNAAKIKNRIRQYEAVVVKYAGQESLDAINASRIAPAAPAEEGPAVPPVQAPAVEPAQVEEPAEPDTTPLPHAEPEMEETEEPEVEEEKTEEPIIDINNIAIYRRNISGNNSDMYRFVQKGEDGQEDGVEDLFQVTDGGRKKKRTDKFSRMENAKTGYIDNNKDKPCIILDINQREGYANVLTNYGIQQMPLERVFLSEKDGVTLRGSNPRLENDAKYTTFESLMSMPLVHVGDRNGLTITVKDVIDGARSKKPYSTIEEQVKIAVEKFAPKNADIDAIVSGSMSEFRKSFNEAARLWNNITTASNLGNSRIKSAMTNDSKHNPILEIRKSFAELSKINNERIEAGEDAIFSDELINSFTAFDASTAFVSKEITELSVPEMIEYAKDIFDALHNYDIVPSEFKTLLNEVLSYLCRKPTKKGNVDHMRHKRNAFMKELGIKAEAEGGVYKDILKEALRKKALKEASKYLVSENLVTELSEEDSANQEDTKQPQEKEEKKDKPAKKPASKVTTALMDSVVSLSVRVNNKSLPKLQRDLAKAALADKLDKLSPEETLELYNMMIAERNVSQGVMVEDITKAIELVESSKKGAIVTQERERIMAAIEAAQAVEEENAEETEETEETDAPNIDFEALIAERNELEDNLPDMSDDEIVAANTRIAEINEILSNQAEFMDGNVAESSASQEAKELALAAEMQSLTDNEEIEVINVTAEQAEEARRTGKGEMQVSNETQRIFVSNAERAVESIKQEKATPQQWKAMIEKQGGLKAGEDKWLGLSEWLDNQEKKTLTRQEILDFISENQILIVELNYADASSLSEDAILNSEYFSMLVDELLDWSGDEPVIDMDKYHEYQEDSDFVDGFGTDYLNETLIVRDPAKAAKYLGMANPIHSIRLRYTTEELDKKKEIAIVVPTIDSYNETDNIHFGDAGNGRAVAWIRFGETTDESGNRVLVIDEIQSKRHQDGRDKGYSNTIELRKKIEEAKQKIADINAKSTNNVQRIDELISEIKELRNDNEEKEDAERYELARLREEQDNVRNNRDYDRLQAEIDEISETQLKRLNHISKLNTELRLLQDRALDSASSDEVFDLRMEIQNYELELLDKVPDAPFDKNWHELAFKRMLRYAAENGFDYVAWTTGAQQAERYDIGEVINKIITTSHTFRGNPRKSVRILMTNGNRVSMSIDNTGIVTISDGGIYNGKNLSEIVGKELADRIINNEGKDATLYSDYTNAEIPAKELSGDNLRIGGEGMKGFYDKMLPSFVSKYTKKWGAKVQDINLPELEESAQTMHAVNVTPEMKESVMQGQPMFSIESTPLMTSKGVIYGYALGNKIYLTPDGMNTNTPVHEYTHIWAKAMQKHNPKAWKSIVEQLKKADALWNEVVNDPNYENIKGNDDAIASEVLSRYSGKNGADKLETEAERVVTEYKGMEKGLKVKALISRVKKALEKFWSWVGKDLFKIESFESVESIADRVLYDMLNNTKLNLDNSKKSSTFAENNENYERTDEFRELQERSNSLPESTIAEYHSEEREFSDEDRRRVGGVFQRLMESERNGGRNAQWINLTGKDNQFKMAQVNPAIFHDIFQICRNYLPNGELVDLHDNYADCKCFISEDGLCGFAIEPNGNLISVFSLNPSDKKGFLYAIKDLIRQEGATHLDCFVSNKQPLAEIYQKALGFHVASEMDYNMEYDHDNIAENHGMPKVAFMVDKPTEKREFDGESYDAAYDYQQSQTSTAEREQIIAEAKANGTFMTAPNGQPTNLTEDQWVATRTQAFKDYFGDWQNEPANASVVLDENGEPLVVYHGSRMAGFDKFGRGEARDSQGIYTTPNRRAAESYATSKEEWKSGQTMPEAELGVPDHHGVYSLFVNMRNPKIIDFGGKEFDRFGTPKYEVATNEAIDNGERGILFDTLEEAEAYIAEHPEEDLDYVEKYTTSDDLLVQAKEEGYDGVIFTNIIDSRYRDPITNYVPFESNQVKSATQNVGTFNTEDDRIEFMIGPAAANETEEKIKKASEDVEAAFVTAEVPIPDKTTALTKLTNITCDSGESTRKFMKALRKYRKKNHLGKLPEGRDIRQIYDNQRVVLKNKVTELFNLYETPLLETLDKLIKVVENSSMYQKYQEDRVVYTIEEEDADGKITTKTWTDYVEITPREFIERYLIACDSVERLNNGIPPRGLREFYSRMGVNVYDFQMEFEAAFASDGEGEALVKELWKRINAYTNYTLEDSYECGMLTEEEYNKRKARKFYVPERDFQAEKELEHTEIKPQKHYRSNKLASSKQAKGDDSLAANIIENMIHIGNIDLSKNNKNRVKLAMFNLLKENEDFRRSVGLPKPEEVWYDSDGKRLTNKPSKSLIERIKWLESQIMEYDSLIAIEERQAKPNAVEIAQLEKEMQDLIDERNSIPYMLEYDARDKFFGENNPHMVGVYVNGVLCSMQFPNMGLIATALNDTWADSSVIRDALKRISGFMGSVITSYEPTFFAVNTVTDSIAILTKGYVELGVEYAARFIATTKDLKKNMGVITAYMTGKDYRSMENGDLFRDFLMNGGNTGYATIRNMEEILAELQVLDNKSNHIKDGVKWTKKALSFTNESAELLLRFAAYKAAIDCGYGIEKATWAANNLSANFNRTGKKFNDTKKGWRALGESMEWFKSISMFTNPAIQGAMSYLRMFGDSGELSTKEQVDKYFRLFNAAMFMPALCGFLNAMMFDDDEKEEWAASEYYRANYLILGKKGKLPVPHMLRPFYNIGVNIAMGMQGRRTGGDIADSIITSFLTHLTPLPPVITETASKGINSAFGNADFKFYDGLESLVTPQGINALKELADGENFLGYKVRYDGSAAQYTKNPNAGAFEKIIAEQFYIWGGGVKGSDSKITTDKDAIGWFWNVSPNEVKSAMQLFLPKSVIDVANITAGAISDEHDIRTKDIPLLNRFVSDRTKEAYRAGIYSEANKIVKANNQIAKAAKDDIERLKIDLGKASSEEERVRIQGEIDFYEGIHRQAKGDVFAETIDINLKKYKRIRMASMYKQYHHDEKSFKELYPDLKYDSIEEAERMFSFNMFQLICMYNGTGKVNDNLPNWMKDVFRMNPSTQEVNEMWEHYQKLQEETNERLGLSEQ